MSKRRILIVSINYWPEPTGIAPFATGLSEALAEADFEVTVLTGFPMSPGWEIYEGYRRRVAQTEHRAGVRILRSLIYIPKRPPGGSVRALKRIACDSTFGLTALLRAATLPRQHVVIVLGPPLQCGLIFPLAKRFWGARCMYRVQDIVPDAAVSVGMMKEGIALNAARRLEKWVYKQADIIGVISAAMRDNLLAKGVDPRKLSLVPDWASVQDFDDVMGDEAPAGAEPNRPFTIVHAGSVAAKQKLEAVVDAMALLRDRADIRLVVIGSGNRIELFKQRAAAAKLANIEFRPTVTGKLYYESLRSADVLLLHQARDIIDVLAPSKLLTYWLSEKPVLAAVHERSQAALMIRNSRSGYVIEPERPELLAETILRMQGEPAVRLEMGRAGGAFVRREYDKRTLLPVIIQLVSEMAKHRVPVREEHMAPAANVIVPKQ